MFVENTVSVKKQAFQKEKRIYALMYSKFMKSVSIEKSVWSTSFSCKETFHTLRQIAQTKAKKQLTNTYWYHIYILLYRGDVVTPFFSIVNSYLEREIALKFYTAVFSLVCGTFPDKNIEIFQFSIFFNIFL